MNVCCVFALFDCYLQVTLLVQYLHLIRTPSVPPSPACIDQLRNKECRFQDHMEGYLRSRKTEHFAFHHLIIRGKHWFLRLFGDKVGFGLLFTLSGEVSGKPIDWGFSTRFIELLLLSWWPVSVRNLLNEHNSTCCSFVPLPGEAVLLSWTGWALRNNNWHSENSAYTFSTGFPCELVSIL